MAGVAAHGVECCAPREAAAQVTTNARANREFLEKALAPLQIPCCASPRRFGRVGPVC